LQHQQVLTLIRQKQFLFGFQLNMFAQPKVAPVKQSVVETMQHR
jgi:hypothetical protein